MLKTKTAALKAHRTREVRVRRMAERVGLRLARSRRRQDIGGYALLDGNLVLFGSDNAGGYDATLDEVEIYLAPAS